MFASFLTTVLFSLSVLFAARSSKVLGGPMANLARITLATCILAIWAHSFGSGLKGAGLSLFLLSGVIGFGLGDIALFGALERIGPRLSILLTQCLAAPIAAALEWAWLGTKLDGPEMLCGGMILVGVATALAPDHGWVGDRRLFRIGVLFGFGSALGQALGAVISRKADAVSQLSGVVIDGGTAAYQRILGGVVMTALCFWFLRKRGTIIVRDWRRGTPFVLVNALAGPTLGVGCYQYALSTTPSGIVLPIVATSPLVTMFLAFFLEGLRPTRRAVVGGLIAVSGAVALSLVLR